MNVGDLRWNSGECHGGSHAYGAVGSPNFAKVRTKAVACFWYALEPASHTAVIPSERVQNLGVSAPFWLVLPRCETTNPGVLDLCYIAPVKRGCANSVVGLELADEFFFEACSQCSSCLRYASVLHARRHQAGRATVRMRDTRDGLASGRTIMMLNNIWGL